MGLDMKTRKKICGKIYICILGSFREFLRFCEKSQALDMCGLGIKIVKTEFV